jgi:hypothetical protein
MSCQLRAISYQCQGPEAEVLEPEELRENVLNAMSRTIGVYERGKIVFENQEVYNRQA